MGCVFHSSTHNPLAMSRKTIYLHSLCFLIPPTSSTNTNCRCLRLICPIVIGQVEARIPLGGSVATPQSMTYPSCWELQQGWWLWYALQQLGLVVVMTYHKLEEHFDFMTLTQLQLASTLRHTPWNNVPHQLSSLFCSYYTYL